MIFIRCSLYKVLSEIVLIELFTMDLYSLIGCIPVSNRFTEKCHCFQSHFYFLSILWSRWKQVAKSSTVLIMSIFLWSKFFRAILALPPPHPRKKKEKKILPSAYGASLYCLQFLNTLSSRPIILFQVFPIWKICSKDINLLFVDRLYSRK